MIQWKGKNNGILLFVVISALIPMLIITYELVFTDKSSVTFTFNSILGVLVSLYYLLLILGGIFAFAYWIVKQIRTIAQLKKEKTQVELMHLKTQVNPHFFFNMLNNLYGWVDKDSDVAKELILKLSDMMRYSIYEGQKDYVTLDEEIDFIHNFVELHKMRYHKNIDITFVKEVSDGHMKVMPLLFIILLENAFKHGVETLRNHAYVNITLTANEQEVYFEVKNNFDKEENDKRGIGIQNLKRRLELAYPNRHTLTTSIKEDVYTAQLKLIQL